MAVTADAAAPSPPSHYVERAEAGDETWLEDAIEDYLGITVTGAQAQICRGIAANERLLVVTANGLGKSYILAAITIVWLTVRYPACSFATSGTERKMKRTYCKPVENLHGDARVPLPGEYKSRPERIEIDGEPEHFFEAASPQDAGELEGVHAAYTLAIIEEADKKDVDAEVLDAMKSLVTDEQDRIIAIANPPKDETNSIYPILDEQDDPTSKWEVLEFSSFDSHNVQVELGNVDDEKVDGLASLHKIQDDWEDYNKEPWPGAETARTLSAPKLDADGNPVFSHSDALEDNPEFRTDLDQRWYRRRAGIIPPGGASKNRPFTIDDVNAAWGRDWQPVGRPQATGIDVARDGGDRTPVISVDGDVLEVRYEEPCHDYTAHADDVTDVLEDDPDNPMPIDAVGEGSGFADIMHQRFPETIRFKSLGVAEDSANYKDCWAEGVALLGKWLQNGGSINDRTLREELLVAARTLEYEETHIGSRGTNGEDVLKLTPKEKVKERLGRSPDYLDASMQAIWGRDSGVTAGIPTATVSIDGQGGPSSNSGDDPTCPRCGGRLEPGRRQGTATCSDCGVSLERDVEEKSFEDSQIGQAVQELQNRFGGQF
ncbi:uncharacterized protein Nmag_1649 [Natrialba magadii ATCC 43099]|uniref:Uncharacterized protein n=1 Tax=Natrialba magadii (strain ATCC 43099 / DSM 3394 / CCM 3739 / CIP 104546 / IAM 13178 / JCM 8861 / NBRC 102185 / NCIMB 2190 / MS3) TaxID=547559 RepID=D3SUG7_NATMM|nr:hypothetical protein [Natrialba magadii]ADD05225.1 uncharacterized protein Nmag_1649 [Natrialba magadii ATCC 43099]ELY23072.1 hypothetical protein C500_20773 [Natrialba magadii ATCC 43099]